MLTLKEILESPERVWTLDDMAALKPCIHVWAMYSTPPKTRMGRLVDGLSPVMLLDEQVDALFVLANPDMVRVEIEAGLHPSSHDGDAGVSFAAMISLQWFREVFCEGSEESYSPNVTALRRLLRWQTIGWASAGADAVDIRFNCTLSATQRP